jgi:sugar phosphate isomerase/epimerase
MRYGNAMAQTTVEQMTRRTWMRTAAFAAGSAVVNAQERHAAPLGAQLYTVRKLLPKDPETTLKAIAEIGYREVEGARADLLQLIPLLRQCKLAPVSAHIETPLVTGNWAQWKHGDPTMKQIDWSEALDSAERVGAKYVVLSYLLPSERGRTKEAFQQFADRMNAAGEKCRAAGLQFCYHNHAFEFQGREGERPIDVLLERFDRKLVELELDVFWVSTAGYDPADFLKRNAGRVRLVHLKDKPKDAPVQYTENVKPEGFAEVGGGSLDFKRILAAAGEAGVQRYIVEQDETPGNPLASLKKSYEYLRNLRAPELDLRGNG